MTPDPTSHLTEEEIARLVHSKEPDSDALAHLRACEACLADYHYLVRESGVQSAAGLPAPPVDLASQGAELAMRPSQRWRTGRGLALAFAAVALIAVAVVRFAGGPGIDPALTQPIQGAIEHVSNRALFVIPGSEGALLGDPPAYRSSFVASDPAITEAMRGLVAQSKAEPSSRDLARWTVAGFLATGQLDIAGDVAEDVLLDFPDDPTIMTLAGLAAYCNGDDTKAERYLRTVIDSNADDDTAAINLALVLARQGRRDEARTLLEGVKDGGVLKERAATILSQL
jgi:hypothetical protein